MIQLIDEEIKLRELEILKYFKEICEENNLKYFLAYGTLLGAVRHKGFIPWDDDIDIIMPINDYNKLITLLKNSKIISKFKFISNEINKDYYYPFAKMCDSETILIEKNAYCGYELGVYIDIFPMYGIDKENFKAIKTQNRLRALISLSMIKKCKSRKWYKVIPKTFISRIAKLYGSGKIAKKIIKNASKFDFETSKYVGCNYTEKEIMPKEIFDESTDILFEGEYYKAPKMYHEYLTRLYGDYMTPPPEKDRVATHGFTAYLKD